MVNWVKDDTDAYHNLDDYCQISVVLIDDNNKFAIRAFAKTKGYVDLFTYDTLIDAKINLKNLMDKYI
jgi:hypothetical protein